MNALVGMANVILIMGFLALHNVGCEVRMRRSVGFLVHLGYEGNRPTSINGDRLAIFHHQLRSEGSDSGLFHHRSRLGGPKNASRAQAVMAEPAEGLQGEELIKAVESYISDTGSEDVTEEDISGMMRLIKDVKKGKLGLKWKQEMEAAEEVYNRHSAEMDRIPGMSDDSPKPNVDELLKQRDEDLEEQLKEVFDISNLEHPTDEDIA